MSNSFRGQLRFPFRIDSGLPFAVSPRSIESLARRVFRSCPDAEQPAGQFRLRRYAERVAMLRQLRRIYRREIRRPGVNAAAYAGTPEGRRVHRAMDDLMLQIAAERTFQCG